MNTDKVTRVLIMYQRLMQGQRIYKQEFMSEHNIGRRSFERDVDDLRLFLSENYTGSDLVYDKEENSYYLTNVTSVKLFSQEATAFSRLLLDSGAFRRDEAIGLLEALISTMRYSDAIALRDKLAGEVANYQSPEHEKALLKMLWDLSESLNTKRIRLRFYDGRAETVVPLKVHLSGSRFVLTALCNGLEQDYWVDEIHSFGILSDL